MEIMRSKRDKLAIFKSGWLMFGTERPTGTIWFSFNKDINYFTMKLTSTSLIDILQLESPKHRVIATVNYDKVKKIYSLILYDFSEVIRISYLIVDRNCQGDDFEIWYVPRLYGNCFQGKEVTYLIKKPSIRCYDDRTVVLPTIKSCPCSLLDFHWYDQLMNSKPNYSIENYLCVWDPFTSLKEPVKRCRDGRIPVNSLNGYEL
ncbi:hypothetical protein RF11_11474 [Thelohanellus kitauei]|uniref:Sortilin C-terminal domain-containing protein n=1 Tax=Thelohanellus kitauei TaxID=669202 RepID=A0A0C2NCI2_THEKT|nr:hypothetical protein RF11_11474 [Thelohanellus kitauei]